MEGSSITILLAERVAAAHLEGVVRLSLDQGTGYRLAILALGAGEAQTVLPREMVEMDF